MKSLIVVIVLFIMGFKSFAQEQIDVRFYRDTFGMVYDKYIESTLYSNEPNIVITPYTADQLAPYPKMLFFYRATLIQIKLHDIYLTNPSEKKRKEIRKYVDYLNYHNVAWQKESVWWEVWTKLNSFI